MVSHETLQLVNCFECLLSYTILHIEDFLLFNSLTILVLKSILLKYDYHIIFLLFSLASNNLTNYGRRLFKPINNSMFRWSPCI